MSIEHRIVIDTDPATVFAVYEKVSEWPQWDLETESASIDGGFEVGTRGSIKPKGAPSSKIELTEVTRDRSFTVECRLPLCRMHFMHEMRAQGENDAGGASASKGGGQIGGTEVTNRLLFTGPLGPVFKRLMGGAIARSIPGSLAGLKAHVERTDG